MREEGAVVLCVFERGPIVDILHVECRWAQEGEAARNLVSGLGFPCGVVQHSALIDITPDEDELEVEPDTKGSLD